MSDNISSENKCGKTVTSDEARQELDRLLSDASFFCADRNRRFLQYIVDEYCADRCKAIKAYTVAVDVFGRGVDFDATHDPIVRIEATRLRTALRQYYDMRSDLPLRIDLPKGHYAPAFTRRHETTSLRSIAMSQLTALLSGLRQRSPDRPKHEPTAPPGRERAFTVAAVVAVPALITLGFVNYGELQASTISKKPTVTLDMQVAEAQDASAARPIEDDIMVGISQFQTFRVMASDADQRSFHTSGISKTAPDRHGNADSYRVRLRYSADNDGQAIWWQVTDGSTGEVLRSGLERVLAMPFSDRTPSQELATKVTVRLAGRRGVIADLETARELAAPTLGNGCVLRAVASLDGGVGEKAALACLRNTLRVLPDDPDASAMLAILTAEDDPSGATELANKAVAIAPSSSRARMAQSIVLYARGKVDAAIGAGCRAMALNPANSSIAAKLSLMLYLSGRWDEGVALAIKTGLIDNEQHNEAAMTLALDAYRTEQYDDAMLRVSQIEDAGNIGVDILSAATLGQQHKTAEAAAALTQIELKYPDFENSLQENLQARHYAPTLVTALWDGLVKAGARSN